MANRPNFNTEKRSQTNPIASLGPRPQERTAERRTAPDRIAVLKNKANSAGVRRNVRVLQERGYQGKCRSAGRKNKSNETMSGAQLNGLIPGPLGLTDALI